MLALISRIRVEGLATTGRVDICAGVKKWNFYFLSVFSLLLF